MTGDVLRKKYIMLTNLTSYVHKGAVDFFVLRDVRSYVFGRWCSMHASSLVLTSTWRVHSLQFGAFYPATIHDTSSVLFVCGCDVVVVVCCVLAPQRHVVV